MKFIIEHKPIAQKRVRFFRKKFSVGTFNPQKADKELVKLLLTNEIKKALDSPIKEIAMQASNLALGDCFYVRISFYITPPESWPQSKKNASYWNLIPCNTKPDLDNLEKFYLDCLNQIVFSDDAKVIHLSSFKTYSYKSQTVIEVTEKSNMNLNPKVEGILKLVNPQHLFQFLNDIKELMNLYEYDKENFCFLVGDHEEDQQRRQLERTAFFLSKIADDYSTLFSQIKKRYPNFHEEIEQENNLNFINN
jgi:Holliday junction resolvase RusA-like endonuclease